MAWIESHVEIGDHPKTYELAELLGIEVAQAVGHLHLLWHFALKFSPDGRLGKFSDASIARGSKWPGDPQKFAGALKKSGWIDEQKNIHDWMEYAGRYIHERERRRRFNKKQTKIAKHKASHETSQETSNSTVPNLTLPNHTDKNKDSNESLSAPSPNNGSEPESGKERAQEIAVALPIVGGKEVPVLKAYADEWAKAYPNVNIQQELLKIRAWLVSNPTKRKTQKGLPRFINSWLAREQDRPARAGSHASAVTDSSHSGGEKYERLKYNQG
ncbi:MAG: hypothetical protein HY547_09250 [Elusimicrobia bacterium]|nr:hypothetical protein [Elusimicrobiota bacterium]